MTQATCYFSSRDKLIYHYICQLYHPTPNIALLLINNNELGDKKNSKLHRIKTSKLIVKKTLY